ncbi:Tetratricopeptide repeat protein [Tsuneonella dongtanensis]|uniref:Tetratricopeptide repeat protein n=1 Tax=Tsuneonella dongtanensis TaxID=692370 RepID=A0A1B2AB28_9SPHN|nr:TIR domain-containing protein [Tsuneonella dongtanensis]ANY19370.1 Tetratricopeptide repeat protein [Tsuneonella dongtanensis]
MQSVENDTAEADRAVSIFFSYSRQDRDRALPIIRMLEGRGFNVWWDGLLEGGTAFARTTEAALESADAIVVLWSETSVQSHWVRDEATRGRDRGRMVPVSIDGNQPPIGFRQIQVLDLTKWKGKENAPEMDELVRAVLAVSGNSDLQLPVTKAAPTAGPGRASRRAVLVGGGAALVLVGGGLAWWQFRPPADDGRTGIAVLPFENLSGDPEQAYFSDGLTSEIRTVLARNHQLQVIGSVSSDSFRDKQEEMDSIGKALGVAFLLNGNVQKMGEIVKITAGLINVATGASTWAESFERPLADIFALQSAIAAAVASALKATMDADFANSGGPELGGTRSVAAFDAFHRGRALFDLHIDEASERAALAKFDEAIRIDPQYAAARAARSRALGVIANQYQTSADRKRSMDEAVAEARRATEIAPRYAAGFSALGYALFYGRLDVRGAREPFERAFEFANGEIDVLSRYAIFCARTGRFAEARMAIEQASALDPLNASVFRTEGIILFAAREYEKAIAAGRHALSINPKRNSVNGDIGDSYVMLKDLDAARASYEAEKNTLNGLTGLAIVHFLQGQPEAAQASLDGLIAEHGDNALYQKAQVLAQWGRPDDALQTLEEARRLQDSGLVYLLNDPFMDPIRDRPRFQQMLKQAGFV